MLWRFLNISKIMFTLYNFRTPKTHLKIITGPSKRCGINQIYFAYLKYIWRFSTNLLVMLFLSYFELLLKLCSVLIVFPPKETPRNCHRSLKWVWHPANLLRLFRLYIKISNKMISFDVPWRFSNGFKVNSLLRLWYTKIHRNN